MIKLSSCWALRGRSLLVVKCHNSHTSSSWIKFTTFFISVNWIISTPRKLRARNIICSRAMQACQLAHKSESCLYQAKISSPGSRFSVSLQRNIISSSVCSLGKAVTCSVWSNNHCNHFILAAMMTDPATSDYSTCTPLSANNWIRFTWQFFTAKWSGERARHFPSTSFHLSIL